MKKKTIVAMLLAFCLLVPLTASPALAVGPVSYFPDVTAEMADPAFWTALREEPGTLLATPEEIAALNAAALTADGANMHDLRNLPAVFDGVARNESLRRGAQADADYYLGWTYDGDGNKATEEYYAKMVDNCADPRATASMPVRYGVAVNRALLVCFPSDEPIYDDPTDPDFDYQAIAAIRVNEPLAVFTTSADGKYYQVFTSCCSGWVKAEDIALCADRTEWLAAWDIPAERRLVFYGSKMYTDYSFSAPETAGRLITMGTVLEMAEDQTPGALVINRLPVHNYVVYLPVRETDGSYRKQPALINAREAVSPDYLPLTEENLARVAFGALGDAYGWGGMLNNEDCTGLNRYIYACFGFDLPRNGNWQWVLPIVKRDMTDWPAEDKLALLDTLPMGTLLSFPGHQMMYLGRYDGKYYVLSTISNAMSPWEDGTRQRVRTTLVNTLDVTRANGNTWLQSLNKVYVLWAPLEEGQENPLPDAMWYQEGVSYCLQEGLMTAERGYFRPDDAATRAETAAALWQLAGKPEPAEAASFEDVPDGAAWETAVRWAREAGVVNGVSDSLFDPDGSVTREQTAALLYRYAAPEEAADEAVLTGYADAEQIADWARPAMAWAVQTGLIAGVDGTTLAPEAPVTRAQLAVILQRYATAGTAEAA